MTNTKRNNNKKGKILIHQGNVFALGGDLIGGILGGVASLGGSAIANLQVPDIQNQRVSANSNADLMSQMGAYKPIEIDKTNTGSAALSGVASGASAGMAFGPWGAAAGGLIGGLSGGISALIGNNKKLTLEDTLQRQQMLAFGSKANEIGNTNFNNNLAQSLAEGGELTTFENGGTHELNPNGGVPQGVDENGTPNLVEQGESKFKDYIFSDRLKYDKKQTFSDMAKKFAKESKERPHDPISKRGLEANLGKLKQSLDMFKLMKNMKDAQNSFAKGGGMYPNNVYNPLPISAWASPDNLLSSAVLNQQFSMLPLNVPTTVAPVIRKKNITTKNTLRTPSILNPEFSTPLKSTQPLNVPISTNSSIPNIQSQFSGMQKAADAWSARYIPGVSGANAAQTADYSTLLRYAPALASGAASITDALGITNKPDYTAATEMDALSVRGERLGNYMGYKPLDLNYFTNQLGANAAATRAGLRGNSGGNRANYMTGLLGADANYNEGLGKLARQATESNLAQKQQVEQFNRGTNQFNAQQGNWEQGINMLNKANAIGLRDQARQIANNAKMGNLNNFVDSLGGIGLENMMWNFIKNDPNLPYRSNQFGQMNFNGVPRKNGGKLKTKLGTYGW